MEGFMIFCENLIKAIHTPFKTLLRQKSTDLIYSVFNTFPNHVLITLDIIY